MTHNYSIIFVNSHVEVYDDNGQFFFSADNQLEAEQDLLLLCA